MLLDKKTIHNAKHILIITDSDSFANASAIYSYILTLHKKVSIVKTQNIEYNLSFLPWFDKIKDKAPLSADYTLEINPDTKYIYDFFKDNEIKINKKMATALYAGVLKRYDAFSSSDCNGIIFTMSSDLIALSADYKLCNEYILKKLSLSLFRLKAIMFKSMIVKENATFANLYISDEELKSSGSNLNEAYLVMKDVLKLVNVERVALFKSDENSKILKIIKED